MKEKPKKVIYSSTQNTDTTRYGELIPSQFQWMTSDVQRATAEKLAEPILSTNN